jgi:hypothetical protein
MPLLPSAGSEAAAADATAAANASAGTNLFAAAAAQYQKPGVVDALIGAVDPQNIRTQISGLLSGGVASLFSKKTQATPTVQINGPNGQQSVNSTDSDWRVRISLPDRSSLFYKDTSNNFLSILGRTKGVIFPYTPSISVTHTARYEEQALTHSNYKNYFYSGSDVSAIQIQGDFTVQNHDDAIYLMAAIYFFRATTKMFFGKDTLAGNPPPIVYLDGYGDYYFPHVSCIVQSFQHTMPPDCDYIEFKNGNQMARLPTTSQLSVTLQPVYSRKNIADNMTLTDFSQGVLLKNRGGFL